MPGLWHRDVQDPAAQEVARIPTRLRRAVASFVAAFAATACGDGPTNAPEVPGLTIRLNAGTSDTALTVVPGGFGIELRDAGGAAVAGAIVTLDALPSDSNPFVPGAYLTRDSVHLNWGRTVTDTTDADGRAGSLLRLGCNAGTAHVRLRIPGATIDTTVTLSITPGAAVRTGFVTADTMVMLGNTLQLRGGRLDQCSNVRPEKVTARADSFGTVNGALVFTPSQYGAATIVLTAPDSSADTVRVVVVPKAVLAATSNFGSAVTRMNLDGSAATTFSIAGTTSPSAPAWGPNGSVVLHAVVYNPSTQYTLFAWSAPGPATMVPAVGVSAYDRTTPRFSADGTWLYYSGGTQYSAMQLMRVHPDGTAPTPLTALVSGQIDNFPAPSPDGTRVAFQRSNSGGLPATWVLTLATGQASILASNCSRPAWSPDGAAVGCTAGSAITVITIGAGVTATTTIGGAFAWTPDSKWFLVAGGANGLRLVNIATGRIVTLLPWTSRLGEPALRPLP